MKRWLLVIPIGAIFFVPVKNTTVDGSEIPNSHLGCIKTLSILGSQLPSSTGDRRISSINSHKTQALCCIFPDTDTASKK